MRVSVKNTIAITFMCYSFVFPKIRSHPDAANNIKTNPLKNFHVFSTEVEFCLNRGITAESNSCVSRLKAKVFDRQNGS